MAHLYIGPYRWLINPPLEIRQRGSGKLVVFIPAADQHPEALQLLEKIIGAIGLAPAEATIAVVRSLLSGERLLLFAEPVLWVMGALLPEAKVGVYDPHARKAVSPPQGFPRQGAYLYVLPGLGEMLQNPDTKKLTWQWIRSLASSS